MTRLGKRLPDPHDSRTFRCPALDVHLIFRAGLSDLANDYAIPLAKIRAWSRGTQPVPEDFAELLLCDALLWMQAEEALIARARSSASAAMAQAVAEHEDRVKRARQVLAGGLLIGGAV